MKANLLKKLAEQLSQALPPQFNHLQHDFEKKSHAILMQTFKKFDLVTRAEFDAQTKVLLRTRKKLDELEKHLSSLENLSKSRQHPPKD